jgi:ubiquinone/menaquinone biosynthesis C-methylase UbiE
MPFRCSVLLATCQDIVAPRCGLAIVLFFASEAGVKLVDSVDKVFAGSIPEVYDDYLVPLIFEQYADDLARRTAALDPRSVLEIAAGSGVVSRAVAAVLDPAARHVVTDLNQPMLERAAACQDEPSRVEWRQADAMELPFADDSFDLVLCQFGAMFFPDRVRAYGEARRVLQEGGSFLFSMWDRIEENDFAYEVTRALGEVFSDDPPLFLARTPHGHHDPATYRAELGEVGFGNIEIEPVDAISVASDPAVPAIAYCQGTPLRNEIEARTPKGLQEATARAADAIRQRFGADEIHGRIRGFVIAGS